MIAGRPCSAPIVFAIADRAAAPTLPVRRALASHGHDRRDADRNASERVGRRRGVGSGIDAPLDAAVFASPPRNHPARGRSAATPTRPELRGFLLSPSIDFPVEPVIRSTLLRRFRAGTRRASPVAWHVLATVLSLPPRRSEGAASVRFRLPHGELIAERCAAVAQARRERLAISAACGPYIMSCGIRRRRRAGAADRHRAVCGLSQRVCDRSLHRALRGDQPDICGVHA